MKRILPTILTLLLISGGVVYLYRRANAPLPALDLSQHSNSVVRTNTTRRIELRIGTLTKAGDYQPDGAEARWLSMDGVEIWSAALSDEEVAPLLEMLERVDDEPPTGGVMAAGVQYIARQRPCDVFSPPLSLRMGEAITFRSGAEQGFVASLTPIYGSDFKVAAFDPNVEVVQSGITVKCTADLSLKASSVNVKLDAKFIDLAGFETLSPENERNHYIAYYQRPISMRAQLKTTLEIPTDRWRLLRLMAHRDPDLPGTAAVPYLMLIGARIIQPAAATPSNDEALEKDRP